MPVACSVIVLPWVGAVKKSTKKAISWFPYFAVPPGVVEPEDSGNRL